MAQYEKNDDTAGVLLRDLGPDVHEISHGDADGALGDAGVVVEKAASGKYKLRRHGPADPAKWEIQPNSPGHVLIE